MPAGRSRIAAREWAGAFGDLGTFVPFALAYTVVAGVPAGGMFVVFGVALIAAGAVYRTPFPVQPMKAIGAVAATQGAAGAALGPDAYALAALLTGLVWLLIGACGMAERLARCVAPPIVSGIVLGLGLALMLEAVRTMAPAPWVSVPVLLGSFLLLARRRFPVMVLLLVVGWCAGLLTDPGASARLFAAGPAFHLPVPALPRFDPGLVWTVTVLLVLPQLPLTFGNAIVAIVDENNRLFPDRPVTHRRVALSTGIVNLFAGSFGGVPVCHGAGGMAGHVRFGARTGAAPAIFGTVLLLCGLFAADAATAALGLIAAPVLGAILFLAGSQLALGACEGWTVKDDRFVLLVTAAVSLWDVGAGFAAGLAFRWLLQRRLIAL